MIPWFILGLFLLFFLLLGLLSCIWGNFSENSCFFGISCWTYFVSDMKIVVFCYYLFCYFYVVVVGSRCPKSRLVLSLCLRLFTFLKAEIFAGRYFWGEVFLRISLLPHNFLITRRQFSWISWMADFWIISRNKITIYYSN